MQNELNRNIKALNKLSDRLEYSYEQIAIYVQEAIEILEIAAGELEEMIDSENEGE